MKGGSLNDCYALVLPALTNYLPKPIILKRIYVAAAYDKIWHSAGC